jgi:hypothetical protein
MVNYSSLHGNAMLHGVAQPKDPLQFPYTTTAYSGHRPGPLHDHTPIFDDPQKTMRLRGHDRGLNATHQFGYEWRSHMNDHPAQKPHLLPSSQWPEPNHLPGMSERHVHQNRTRVAAAPLPERGNDTGYHVMGDALVGTGLPIDQDYLERNVVKHKSGHILRAYVHPDYGDIKPLPYAY